jgi:hypothetical protein
MDSYLIEGSVLLLSLAFGVERAEA